MDDRTGPPPEIAIRRIPELTSYAEGLELQAQTREAVEAGNSPSVLILLEHTPVITLGRNAHEHHLLRSRDVLKEMGVDVIEADRGGDVTYHGPGQLVAYPILNLSLWKESVGWYLRRLEDSLIRLVAHYDLQGERAEGMTGVWVNGAKVAAIGIGVRNWITYHGIALNVDPQMKHFELIVPCGITDKPVTTLRALLGEATPSVDAAAGEYAAAFRTTFSKPTE